MLTQLTRRTAGKPPSGPIPRCFTWRLPHYHGAETSSTSKPPAYWQNKHNLIFNVDNWFATPIGQDTHRLWRRPGRPLRHKWIDGQGRVLGGAIVGKKELIKEVYLFCRSTGPALSPFNRWVLSESLETLDVRMERHSSNALHIAQALEAHPPPSPMG